MELDVRYSFKKVITCLYVFPISYIAVLLLSWLGSFNGSTISQRIRTELCNTFAPNDWVNSVWRCREVDDAGLENFDGLAFFPNAERHSALLVKTTKTNDGTKVEEVPELLHSTQELIRLCNNWAPARKEAGSPLASIAILDELCPMVEALVSRSLGNTTNVWATVYSLLANLNNKLGFDIAHVVSRFDLLEPRNVVDLNLKELMWPLVEYMRPYKRTDMTSEMIVTSDKLLKMQSSLTYVTEMAIPPYFAPDDGGSRDTVFRLFTTFPEAAAMFAFAVQHELVGYPVLHTHNTTDSFARLAVFIATMQIRVTSTFDKTDGFSKIASEEGMDWQLEGTLDQFWDTFAEDERSRKYLMNLFMRAGYTLVDPNFHHVMAYNVDLAGKITAHIFANHGAYGPTPLSRTRLGQTIVFHILQMCKFAMVDQDKNGQLSLYEYAKSVIKDSDPEQIKQQVQELLEKQGTMLQYDVDLINGRAKVFKREQRKALEAINGGYNEVLDTFMILDLDGSGDLSLDEFIQHSYTTDPLIQIYMDS
ncbi:guanylyl cyclase-activating 1-like, putative [Babesia ovis]|uniref:Guanylyl cyclase-activating 1-like, putative n=1 Tax=Babesia ovis TaxID=5869 RepID=A0A9W5T8G3_BABOV|nr:guanylyl cyclase-activating 1-like, putative [Babesia ovis]